jgi:hypothetical protein
VSSRITRNLLEIYLSPCELGVIHIHPLLYASVFNDHDGAYACSPLQVKTKRVVIPSWVKQDQLTEHLTYAVLRISSDVRLL